YYLEVMSQQNTSGGDIRLWIAYSGLLSNHPVPAISNLQPRGAPAGADPLTMVIGGTGFTASTTVQFGSKSLVPASVTSNSLTVAIPAASLADEATISVSVSNPEPGGGTSGAATFTVYPPPSIAAIAPTSVLVGS